MATILRNGSSQQQSSVSVDYVLTALHTTTLIYNWHHIASLQDQLLQTSIASMSAAVSAAAKVQSPTSTFFWILSWTYGQFEIFFLSIKDFFRISVYNTLCLLIVSSTFFDSLSNGANNSSMFHQGYFLSW